MQDNPFFQESAPDFSDPLGLLKACHGRIVDFCATLQKLPDHLEEHGLDDEARTAISRIHRYFTTAAPLHHQDEEEDLFPLLARTSLKLAELVHELRGEHEIHDALWDELSVYTHEPTKIHDIPAFRELVERFAGAYMRHADKENEQVLSVAEHLLSQKQLTQLGNSMAVRRGLKRSFI